MAAQNFIVEYLNDKEKKYGHAWKAAIKRLEMERSCLSPLVFPRSRHLRHLVRSGGVPLKVGLIPTLQRSTLLKTDYF